MTLRSTEVQPGDLYVGIQGLNSHGAAYAAQAAESGAVAVLTDAAGADLAADSGLPIVLVESPRTALGDVSAWVYRTNEHPPLLLGVTGTNGKTSTSYLVEAILKQLGLVTGLSSTAERHIGSLTVVSRLTTPEASEMHALLARMRESEVRAVAVEVSAAGAQPKPRRRARLRRGRLHEPQPRSSRRLCRHGGVFPGQTRLLRPGSWSSWSRLSRHPLGQRVVEASRIPVTTISTTPGVIGEWNVEILDEQAAYTEFRLTGPEGRRSSPAFR